MNSSSFGSEVGQTVTVSRGDRWQVHQRLQQLEIACWCLENGQLKVEVNTLLEAMQVRSVLLQVSAPRAELLTWLDQCFYAT